MTRHDDRYPLWKIIALGAGSLVLGAALTVSSLYIRPAEVGVTTQPADDANRAAMNLSSLMLIVGLMGLAVACVCVGWLGYRYYLSIPAWKRRKGPPKRR